jgi:protein involved in polysaccharide export with SLBB domain
VRVLSRWSFLLLALLFASCSATGYPIADLAAEINATRDVTHVALAPGDVIRLKFPLKSEWDQDVRVRPDGTAAFPLVDEMPVAGLSLAELDNRLSAAYLKLQAANAEQLTIDVLGGALSPEGGGGTTVPPDSLFVVGEVERPGPVPLNGRPWTLCEAISAAGGHRKATANLRNTILIRRLASGRMQSWRLDADIYTWGQQPPIYLQTRDIVFVPNTAIDAVDIWVDKYIRQLIPLPTLFPAP